MAKPNTQLVEAPAQAAELVDLAQRHGLQRTRELFMQLLDDYEEEAIMMTDMQVRTNMFEKLVSSQSKLYTLERAVYGMDKQDARPSLEVFLNTLPLPNSNTPAPDDE